MKKVSYILMLAVSFLLVNSLVYAQCGGSKNTSSKFDCKSETAKIAAINFHGDNCKESAGLDPKIKALNNKFDNKVVFVQFDLTNENSKAKTRNLAVDQGLVNVLESNNGTGYVVLYDLKSKKVLAKLDNTLSIGDIEKTIKNYL
jgi:hypothetical protein